MQHKVIESLRTRRQQGRWVCSGSGQQVSGREEWEAAGKAGMLHDLLRFQNAA
jgi:hypothetical protein